jgi:hypothetical protein
MDKKQRNALIVALVVGVGLIVVLSSMLRVPAPLEMDAQSLTGYAFRLEDANGSVIFSISDDGNVVVSGTSQFEHVYSSDDAVVADNLAAGSVTVTETVSAAGITSTGDLVMSDGHIYRQFEDLTVADGDTITPTARADTVALDTTGAVTVTIAACSTDGHELTLIGDDNNAIVINATNLRTTDGAALGMDQYDVVKLVCQDTEWLVMLESNNQ